MNAYSNLYLKSLLSPNPPDVSSLVLNYIDAFEVLTEQLLFIINLSLRTQTFPTAWKKSLVITIPKKGDRHLKVNTQPISLIHIGGKLLEKIVNSLVGTYLKNNRIITDRQFGFVKNKSTIACIATLCKDLFYALNNNQLVCCLFLDYSKALDRVNHQIILNKL